MSTASRERWRRLALIVVSTAFALLAAEIALHIFVETSTVDDPHGFVAFMRRVAKLPKQRLYRYSENEVLEYEFVPGTVSDRVRINSAGFRGPEYSLEPAPGITRIAVMGDSEAFAEGVREEETLSGQLERLLNEKAGRRGFEVLNFGVTGYNTVQEWELLRTKAMQYRPKLVILYYVMNDPEIYRRARLSNFTIWSRSYLYMLMMFDLQTGRDPLETLRARYRDNDFVPYFQELHSGEMFAYCARTIRQIDTYLAAKEIPLLLVLSPELYGYASFDQYPHWNIHRMLFELESKNLTVVDPMPKVALLGKTPRELWVTPYDPHKNAETLLVVAREVANRLQVDGSVVSITASSTVTR